MSGSPRGQQEDYRVRRADLEQVEEIKTYCVRWTHHTAGDSEADIRNSSSLRKDAQGNDHLLIHFNVEGPRNQGVVHVHLIRRAGKGDYEYKHLYLDVRGHQRIYLENSDAASKDGTQKPNTRLFGIKWA